MTGVRSFAVVLLAAALGWGSAATAEEAANPAAARLERLSSALASTPFRGRSLYLSGDRLTTVEILHGVFRGEAWERVIHLSGTPAEIVRRGSRFASLHPDAVSEMRDTRAPAVSAALGSPAGWRPSAQYALRDGGHDRVAGRAAARVDVVPLDTHRHGLHVWLDDATGLMLKSVIVDREGRALDLFEFVSLEPGVVLSEADFVPGNGLSWAASPDEPAPTVPSTAWAPGWLPAGFEVSERAVRPLANAEFARSYSDGLATFSIFVEPWTEETAEGSRKWGATVAVSRRMADPVLGHLVTVVGEIPLETALQVATGVRPGQDGPSRSSASP